MGGASRENRPTSVWPDASSYVQVNIYDTNLDQLRARGVDMKNILESIGCRSIIMDVPILNCEITKSPILLGTRAKSLGCYIREKEDSLKRNSVAYGRSHTRRLSRQWSIKQAVAGRASRRIPTTSAFRKSDCDLSGSCESNGNADDTVCVEFVDCHSDINDTEKQPCVEAAVEQELGTSTTTVSPSTAVNDILPAAVLYEATHEELKPLRSVIDSENASEKVAAQGGHAMTKAFFPCDEYREIPSGLAKPSLSVPTELDTREAPNNNAAQNCSTTKGTGRKCAQHGCEAPQRFIDAHRQSNVEDTTCLESQKCNYERLEPMSRAEDPESSQENPVVQGGELKSGGQFPPPLDYYDHCFASQPLIHTAVPTLSEVTIPKAKELLQNSADQSCSTTIAKKTAGRKRTRRGSGASADAQRKGEKNDDGKKATSVQQETEDSRILKCHMPGCTTTMKWHPRMGRNRLLDHVRTHWRKKVKKCKLCDFEAIDVRKVHRHHTLTHTSDPFMGALSNESKQDWEELQQMYSACFPEDNLPGSKMPRCGIISPHTRKGFAKQFDKPISLMPNLSNK